MCNGIDDDCDGTVDEDDAVDALTWYLDDDGDGFGDPNVSVVACDAPADHLEDDTDCDDADAEVHPAAEEVCNGIDDDCDGVVDPGALDADGDGIPNCLDPTVYAYDYDDGAWTGWTYVDLGGGNAPIWSMSGGTLHEASNAALSIAYGPDLGPLDSYTITVDVTLGGAACNAAAIVFAMQDVDDYWLAEWIDPNDYYGWSSPPAALELSHCELGVCTTMAADDDTLDLSLPYWTWTTLAVSVDGEDVTLTWDGQDLVSYSAVGLAPLGADIVGVYTYDNDSGVYYDNFTVTNP